MGMHPAHDIGFIHMHPNTCIMRVVHCVWTIYTDNMVYTEHLLSFGDSGILYMLSTEGLRDQPLIKP